MKHIKVTILEGAEINGMIASAQAPTTAEMTLDELHDWLAHLGNEPVSKMSKMSKTELKRIVKKMKHEVVVLCVKDVVDPKSHHIWLVPAIQKVGESERPVPTTSELGRLSTAPASESTLN